MSQSSGVLNMCYNHRPGISEQAFAINYISQSVRSSFHSTRRRKRGLGRVPISLFLYPSVFDKLPMQYQPKTSEGNAFLIQSFTAMKGSQKIIGRARQSLSTTISVPYLVYLIYFLISPLSRFWHMVWVMKLLWLLLRMLLTSGRAR